MQIQELLNPASSSETPRPAPRQVQLLPLQNLLVTQQPTPAADPLPAAATPPPSLPPPRQKPRKDEPALREQAAKGVNFPPFSAGSDPALRAELERWAVWPAPADIARFTDRIPYHSEKKNFGNLTGRDAFEVFAYRFEFPEGSRRAERGPFWVTWDYQVGLVRITPFFKALGYQKTAPGRMLNVNPGLQKITHSITGGALKGQGYWMPYSAAKAIAATFSHDIRHALVPLFGPDFPGLCAVPAPPAPPPTTASLLLAPGAVPAAFPNYRIHPDIVRDCAEETRGWLRRPDARLLLDRGAGRGGDSAAGPSSSVAAALGGALRLPSQHMLQFLPGSSSPEGAPGDQATVVAADEDGTLAAVSSAGSMVAFAGGAEDPHGTVYSGQLLDDEEVSDALALRDAVDLEPKTEGQDDSYSYPFTPGGGHSPAPAAARLCRDTSRPHSQRGGGFSAHQQLQISPPTTTSTRRTTARGVARGPQGEHQRKRCQAGSPFSLAGQLRTTREAASPPDDDEDLSPRSTPRSGPGRAAVPAAAGTPSTLASPTPFQPPPPSALPTVQSPLHRLPAPSELHAQIMMVAMTPHPPLHPLPPKYDQRFPTASATTAAVARPEPPATPVATPERGKAPAAFSFGSPLGGGGAHESPLGALQFVPWSGGDGAVCPGNELGLGICAAGGRREQRPQPPPPAIDLAAGSSSGCPPTSEEWKRKRKWELFVADEMPADGDQRGVRARWLGAYANVVEAALALVAMSQGRNWLDEWEELELIRRYLG